MTNSPTTARRALVCSWCSQSFSKQEHLDRHVRTHTREKPFSCHICRKAFSRNDTLLRHTRGHRRPSNARQGSSGARLDARESVAIREPTHQPGPDAAVSVSGSADGISSLLGLDQPMHYDASAVTPFNPDSLEAPSKSPGWCLMGSSNPGAVPDSTPLDPRLAEMGASHTNQNIWDTALDLEIPAWLASSDFDLDALNSSILVSPPSWPLDEPYRPYLHPKIDGQPGTPATTSSRKEDLVRQQWFTFLGSHDDYIVSDANDEPTKVDERYREHLSQRLQQRVPYEPLPSTAVLNICIQMYFTRFNPIFPIVHAPTFRPSAKSSLLLLSICSLGSLFIGSSHAAIQGQKIFERLNKAILASWDNVISRGRSETLAMTQAGLIGQTFGMLSGRPSNLLLVQAFHGTVITWARRCGAFQPRRSREEICDMIDHDLDRAWKAWVQAEEQSRVAAALYIHDAELSTLFHVEPLMRPSTSKLPFISSNDLWLAPTAEAWKAIFCDKASRDTDPPQNLSSGDPDCAMETPTPSPIVQEQAHFGAYCELEGIAVSILNAKELGTWPATLPQLEQALLGFFDKYLKSISGAAGDPFYIEVLWHATFISLFTDLNQLEMSSGRDGYERAQRHVNYAKTWARSADGRRCALHGALILRKLENMPIGAEPAIHVPRVLYCAALVWYCYTEFGQGDDGDDDAGTAAQREEFPEFERLGIRTQQLIFEVQGFRSSRPAAGESSTLCGLVDLLRRIGHWEISRKLASLMTALVHGDPP
ncbi:Early growth response protein [Pleurostoma richardsiae]|uniref:Early growth response protein n=1 Tax=Pleurostoma richardsiae TaxID=41990 RepID=A0AA38VQA0_9PEZI|nr:Early growth response protein [Pleurostoma richardsiae]